MLLTTNTSTSQRFRAGSWTSTDKLLVEQTLRYPLPCRIREAPAQRRSKSTRSCLSPSAWDHSPDLSRQPRGPPSALCFSLICLCLYEHPCKAHAERQRTAILPLTTLRDRSHRRLPRRRPRRRRPRRRSCPPPLRLRRRYLPPLGAWSNRTAASHSRAVSARASAAPRCSHWL